ncbi:prepilin-type N-terminal cleavage/methylation domain-containing protein [Limisphaera sp. 4302-co]|uniref:prepilin-type N-terminal cleavage/methylation domain-containing protein n=1 Tax=Limisphaera sp. 4302-co TaxID=3400417 RepID=UPI003C204C2F
MRRSCRFRARHGFARQRPPAGGRPGFTLPELLVVVGIVGVLAALLAPAWARGREAGRRARCISQLRQLSIALDLYTGDWAGFFVPAYGYEERGGIRYLRAWDFTTVEGDALEVLPGTLWEGRTVPEVQQCPEYHGPANWAADPYTGYNYNTSYLGHGQFESVPQPSRVTSVRNPSATVAFGDGQYGGGANKFMRAPWPNPGDASFRGRWAGTQGFRHGGRTLAVFVDGHVQALSRRYVENADGSSRVAPGTGFLSPNNSLYDLD